MSKPLSIVLFATLSLGLLSTLARDRAHACGVWRLERGKQEPVSFLIHTVTLGKRRVFSIWGKAPGQRAVATGKHAVNSPRGHAVLFRFRGDGLYSGKKRVGELKGASFSLGKRRYEIAVKKSGERWWTVQVKQGDKVVARTKRAMAFCEFCGGSGVSKDKQRREIRERVAFFLAWQARAASAP